jgi:alkylation response protein AidB-like acyl-CoA dehydrogenase
LSWFGGEGILVEHNEVDRMAAPTPEELMARVHDMLPEIRGLAEETERNRNLSPQIVVKIRDAELLRICRPKEFGGFEYDAVVALEIALAISAACASTGWAVNGALSNGISFGHFPIEAQRELWGGGDDPFSCACFAPTGTAVPTERGYLLSGKWSFASGSDHSSWIRLGALITSRGAAPPHDGAFFLLPIGDVEIEDNWFVCGLSGTGSKNIIVSDVFVPEHRVLLFAEYALGPHARRATITRTRSTGCRFWCSARRCWPRPRSARREAPSPPIGR